MPPIISPLPVRSFGSVYRGAVELRRRLAATARSAMLS